MREEKREERRGEALMQISLITQPGAYRTQPTWLTTGAVLIVLPFSAQRALMSPCSMFDVNHIHSPRRLSDLEIGQETLEYC